MPLTEAVSFKTLLQKGNRVQVPRLVRWQFKLEATQVLRVTVKIKTEFSGESERFYARISGDGRIVVPWLALALLEKRANAGKSLTGYVFEVIIEPAEGPGRSMTEQ